MIIINEVQRGGFEAGPSTEGSRVSRPRAPLRRPPGQTTRPCTGTCCGPAACTGWLRSRPQPWSATR